MKKQGLKEFEARVEKMNPRKRRAFLHSLYTDLMGYNHSENMDATVANSPHLRKAHDVSLKAEREYIECGAEILKRFGFTSHAKKLLDSYTNAHLSIDASEGYTVENRTRALDRLSGTWERAVLFPKETGHVIQVQLHRSGHISYCVSPETMTREQAMQEYSVDRFPMGISGVGFGSPVAQKIVEGTLDNERIIGQCMYDCIQDKTSFKKAVALAHNAVA